MSFWTCVWVGPDCSMATSKMNKSKSAVGVAASVGCANCRVHDWKTPKKTTFIRCTECEAIQYCGKLCRDEHYEKVHKNHCQYLAHPETAEESKHDVETCAICLLEAAAGEDKYKMANSRYSSIYRCIMKGKVFPPSLDSPHPFPLAGLAEDQLEKASYVLQLLIDKIQLTKVYRPAGQQCTQSIDKIAQDLWRQREAIWRERKISVRTSNGVLLVCDLFLKVSQKVLDGNKVFKEDKFQLWKTVMLVYSIEETLHMYRILSSIKDPINTFPEELRPMVERAMNSKYKDIAVDVLDSLSTEIIPYQDIVEKICGGDKKKECSFCGDKIVINEVLAMGLNNSSDKSVIFEPLSTEKYSCGRPPCQNVAVATIKKRGTLSLAVHTSYFKRGSTSIRCDYCFKLGPVTEGHRCNSCLTVMYCSRDCRKEDVKNHKKNYCATQNVEDWKMKEDREDRTTAGKERQMKAKVDHEKQRKLTKADRNGLLNEMFEAFQFEDYG